MTDTYVIAAFTVMQKKSTMYQEYKKTETIGKAVEIALQNGADYISIRRIRHE